MLLLTAALLVTAPLPAVMPVEFRLVGQAPQTTQAAVVMPAGTPLPLAPPSSLGSAADSATGGSEDNPAPVEPHFIMAHGFGHEVPLAFAVRQVVPARVRVTYGVGVDHRRTVTWTGGKPWNEVLKAAVAPLGFHLVMSHMAVAIVE